VSETLSQKTEGEREREREREGERNSAGAENLLSPSDVVVSHW
jgi:hypothetical protein